MNTKKQEFTRALLSERQMHMHINIGAQAKRVGRLNTPKRLLCEASRQVRSRYAYAVKWQLEPLQTEPTYSLYPLYACFPCFDLLTAIHKYLK